MSPLLYKAIWLGLIIGCGVLFVLFALSNLLYLLLKLPNDNIWINDFFGLWSYAKFLLVRPFSEIYDNTILLDFQMDLGACPKCLLPYAYPPFFLFYISPLAVLSYYVAFLFWNLATLSFYFFASLEKTHCRYAAFLTIFAPATITCLSNGQTGLLSSALIVGGFRLVTTRPILSGALFGLASFKPQLGILIPIALISARLWRTLLVACITILVLVLASSLAFGGSMWPLWFENLLPHADWVLGITDRYNPTITSNLTSIGVSLPVARGIQACVAVIVAMIIWIFFRHGVTTLATASVLVGTFLAAPYAIVNDMPMVTNAVLAVARDRELTNRGLTIPELIILAAALVVPAIMVATWRPAMLRSIPIILLFGIIVQRVLWFRSNTSKLA